MRIGPIKFNELAEAPGFIRLYRLLCELLGFRLVLLAPDMRGKAFLDYRNEEFPLCTHLRRNSQEFDRRCREDEVRNCREAVAEGKGRFYKCHAGLVDIIVPVFINGKHVASFVGGQIFQGRPTDRGFEKFYKTLAPLGYDKRTLRKMYFKNCWLPKEKFPVLLEAITLFAEHFQELGSRIREKPSKDDAVEKIKRHVQKNLSEPLSLEDAAVMTGLTPQHVSSLFKKKTGENYTEYVRGLRIEKAMRLLRGTSIQVSRVAYESGFSSVPTFNRCFRRAVGISPKQYRNRKNTP